jgi:D-cysteine desulfhydrase
MFQYPPKISLARIPTPIDALPRLSKEYGIDLRVKKDYLTELELSGNKVRKLEYLLADALQKKCDAVITCGATTSNHARATVLAARRVGLEPHLILAGNPPAIASGNLQLDLLAGAHVDYISWEDYSTQIDRILHKKADALIRQGKNPYIIPTGGSNALGLVGYIEAVQEMKQQCVENNWLPDSVICAVGSGGTYSGLFLGNALYSLAAHILGVLVCGTIKQFREKISNDIAETCYNSQISQPSEETIELLDGYYGEGYAKTNSSHLRLIRKVAETEGMVLDPVYTGKAFYGMIQEIQKGRIPAKSNVLFIHTGGLCGLSAFTDEMNEEWPDPTFWNE